MATLKRRRSARVIQYGEVFTPEHIVRDMVDLVDGEVRKVESRVLEPACGTGNFLVEILRRKLETVEARCNGDEKAYTQEATTSIASLYGIDILGDNVQTCRDRLYELFRSRYECVFGHDPSEECELLVRQILERNIIHGNTLTMMTVGDNPQPIVFTEWSFPERRDFRFCDLVNGSNLSLEL